MENPEYKYYIDGLIDKAMVKILKSDEHIDINPDSYEEIKSLAAELDELL